jgi:predicted amidophosphoribosyltransferase
VEYLARLLERDFRRRTGEGSGNCFPLLRCLRRLPSRSQKVLSREDRKTNLRGRIRCVKPPPAEVLLLDDLVTTGSTLDACAQALKQGGARRIRGFCLFYD